MWKLLLRLVFAVIAAISFAAPTLAQQQNSGGLTGLIEDKLSAPNRILKFNGVSGALSSHATIEEITISDNQGVWLRITDAELKWTRSSLLRGHLEIETLSAQRITIYRNSLPNETPALPDPEASGFSIPDLPVTVNIQNIIAKEFILEEAVIGLAATMSLQASAQLDDAGLQINLAAIRKDGPGGEIDATIDYRREQALLSIDISVEEPENGVIANALNIENTPPISARIFGTGPLADAFFNISLDVNGARLAEGRVELKEQALGHVFAANLTGQISPLVPADYRGFFTGDSVISATGTVLKAGGILLPSFSIETADFSLSGALETETDWFPRSILVTGSLVRERGEKVVMPFGNGLFSLQQASLDLAFGQTNSGDWDFSFSAEDIDFNGMTAKKVSGAGSGQSSNLGAPEARAILGDFDMQFAGLAQEAGSLITAVGGDMLRVHSRFAWLAGGPFNIGALELTGEAIDLTIDGQLAGKDFAGNISGSLGDLSMFSVVAGRELAGSIELDSQAAFGLIGGEFDITFRATGDDIKIDDERVDPLLAGHVLLSGEILRNTDGIAVKNLRVQSPEAEILAVGALDSKAATLNASASLNNIGLLLPGLQGAATLTVDATGPLTALNVSGNLETDSGIELDVSGQVGDALNLEARLASFPLEVANIFMPDLGLTGQATAGATIAGTLSNPIVAFDTEVSGFDAAMLKPYNLGAISLNAKGNWGDSGLQLQRALLTINGGTRITANGRIAADFGSMDISASGAFPVSLLSGILSDYNISASGDGRFDMRGRGALTSPDLSGNVSLANGAFEYLGYNVGVNNIAVSGALAGQTLNLGSFQGDIAGGGHLSGDGTIGIQPNFPVNLTIAIDQARYSDNKMISTVVGGNLTIVGNLASRYILGGAMMLGLTEFQIPSALGISTDITAVEHDLPSRPVRRTLVRAGLSASGPSAESDAPLGFDLEISAPQQIFVRGRGVDAELAGRFHLSGPLSNLQANGAMNLVRGRMSFLDRRLTFTEGAVVLSGPLDPQLNFLAQVDVDNLAINLRLIGPVTAPEIVVTSSPDLPQDEILARLIFSRNMSELSPFQILKLASAVAELSGVTGSGLIEKLRQASGLDNIDIGQNDSAETDITAGKYLGEGIYTEIEVSPSGNDSISINLDIITDITIEGRVSTDGESSIGLYFERDY